MPQGPIGSLEEFLSNLNAILEKLEFHFQVFETWEIYGEIWSP